MLLARADVCRRSAALVCVVAVVAICEGFQLLPPADPPPGWRAVGTLKIWMILLSQILYPIELTEVWLLHPILLKQAGSCKVCCCSCCCCLMRHTDGTQEGLEKTF
jgi:hypothetical protein